MEIPRRNFIKAAGATALASFSRPLRAQSWPSRIIHLEVGFPPGGGMDSAARIVANRLSDRWGQQVVIENRPGASGRIAFDTVAHADADGYTVLIASGAPAVNGLLFSSLSFDPAADFSPLSLIGTYPNVIVVPNTSPSKTLAEFVSNAKDHPGKLTWASPGVGSGPHLAGELFKRMAGIDITHVPYRGVAAGAMTDLIAGRLDAMFNTSGSLLQPVRSKQVRGLAVTSADRFPTAPELPAARETVGGYELTSWYGLYVPAKTPSALVKKMNIDVAKALNSDDVKQKYADLGIIIASSTPKELAARNASEVARLAPIIKEADIKID
jgi:tripartite-type tricarboxylate transporter receptor subunit TctC